MNTLSGTRPIRVMIVDDSPTARLLLHHVFSSDPDCEVVGTAADGLEAIETIADIQPDVVTMDIQMPRLDGYDSAQRIMQLHPVPIVVVSALAADDLDASFRALKAGALALVPRPEGPRSEGYESGVARIVATVKSMSQVKVVRRRGGPRPMAGAAAPAIGRLSPAGSMKAVAIGASTGGPPVIEEMLRTLDPNFPAPVLIVQHMVESFIPGFVGWLGRTSRLPVSIPFDGERFEPGRVYVAAGGQHLTVAPDGAARLHDGPPIDGHRPSVTALFHSARDCWGSTVVGVLLTGMGVDGAAGLAAMKSSGALTLAQDRESTVVWGMPGAASESGAACKVIPPRAIVAELNARARGQARAARATRVN